MNGLPGIKGDMVGFVSCILVTRAWYTFEVLFEILVTLPTASWVEFTGYRLLTFFMSFSRLNRKEYSSEAHSGFFNSANSMFLSMRL